MPCLLPTTVTSASLVSHFKTLKETEDPRLEIMEGEGRVSHKINCQHFTYGLMRDFLKVPYGLDKKKEKQRPVHYITEMVIVMNYCVMLTLNPICIFIYPRKVQITYSPL